ncbi:MAG: UTRA domain-containing protein [Rubellimicrobium sp.]|nr:UTRA domain-containing protein [Rubellimicrobium sp.]
MHSDTGKPPTGWQAIRDDVVARIRARDWPPGGAIPHEAALAQDYGCARSTVNRALRDVAAMGLIDRRRKAGSRVALAPARRATLDIPLIEAEVTARGQSYGYALLSRDHGPAPLAVCARLGLPQGAPLLHLTALHLADGQPHMAEDRWINPEAVPGLLDVDFTTVSANAWLVRNMPYSEGELILTATQADAPRAEALDCAEGAALFTMERVTWIDDRPITLVRQFYAPGHRVVTQL